MKITGIICEYNPFHHGHIHHIQKTRAITNPDVLVCVMSGNFVQRGEAAIIDKWERARVAVENGCDIVFELPFIYCTQSANHFAKGGIDCLKLAQVDAIVFGSETNNLRILKEFAQMNDDVLKEYMKKGISSAKAYEQIYGALNANDILAINYLKQLKGSKIIPYTIQRTNNYHEEGLNHQFSSATAIRKAVKEHRSYESETVMHNLDSTFMMEHYFPLLKTLLLTFDVSELHKIFLMDEGIENNLIKHVKVAESYEHFVSLCSSKRYTKAKIQRTIIHLLNQTKKDYVNQLTPLTHLRVLAYNEKGKEYLRYLKDKEICVASKFNQIPERYREMELKAAYVYAYPLDNKAYDASITKELQPPLFIK